MPLSPGDELGNVFSAKRWLPNTKPKNEQT
jgi:hypothetical protein